VPHDRLAGPGAPPIGGASLDDIAAALGHRGLKSVMRYANLRPEDRKAPAAFI
jgi:hypothetical protein